MGRKLLPLIYAVIIASLVSLALVFTGVFDGMELKMLDFRYFFRNSEEYEQAHAPEDIVIIGVDQKSLDDIGKWPWRRLYYNRLIEFLRKEKARVIFFDLFLLQEDASHPEDDKELIERVKEAGNVYFDYYFYTRAESLEEKIWQRDEAIKALERFTTPYEDTEQIFPHYSDVAPPFASLVQAVKGVGHANIEPSRLDGITRKISLFNHYNGQLYPHIALQIYLDLREEKLEDVGFNLGNWRGENWITIGDTRIPVDYKASMLANYLGSGGTVLKLSYSGVLDGSVQYDWEDKIVMIGATVSGMMYEDVKMTPLGWMYGIETIATALQNLLDEDFIKRAQQWLDFVAIFALALVTAGTMMLFSPVISVVVTIIILIGYLGVSQYFFDSMSLWIAVVPPWWGAFLTLTAATGHRFALEQREKRRIRNTFARYVVPTVVDEVLKHPEKLKLGGEKKKLTVLFSDIRNFTSWSETLPADIVVGQLNEYLNAMSECIFKWEGDVDKYIGDAIMSTFGLVRDTDHARHACRAALMMMVELKKLHAKWEKEGRSKLDIGIGINSGEMVVGNIGSKKTMNYTVIGDAVNLASRLEGANKEYGTHIIISEFTYEAVKDQAEVKELGETTVRGRLKPIKIFELIGWKE